MQDTIAETRRNAGSRLLPHLFTDMEIHCINAMQHYRLTGSDDQRRWAAREVMVRLARHGCELAVFDALAADLWGKSTPSKGATAMIERCPGCVEAASQLLPVGFRFLPAGNIGFHSRGITPTSLHAAEVGVRPLHD